MTAPAAASSATLTRPRLPWILLSITVPLVVTTDVGELRPEGVLADVAPTVLHLMGLKPPASMQGGSLLQS